MISSVRGSVLSAGGGLVVIEVGGVGLAVQVTPQQALLARIGEETRLHTALIVREDDLSLYGFATAGELVVFDLLRGVSGVGPKSALGVLATLTPEQVAQAVADEDDAPFRKVSGIGPKTAKLIAVSLAGKLAPVAAAVAVAPGAPGSQVASAVVGALVGLGYPERVAAQAVEEAAAEAPAADAASVQALLRLALARLGPQQVRS
jgi:holliday junction DNA helicase RuvA